jgi:uncharacterized membrane-anchored protein
MFLVTERLCMVRRRCILTVEGDYVSQSQSRGGLDFGTKKTSAVFLIMILGLVVYLTKTRKDALPHPSAAEKESKVGVMGSL